MSRACSYPCSRNGSASPVTTGPGEGQLNTPVIPPLTPGHRLLCGGRQQTQTEPVTSHLQEPGMELKPCCLPLAALLNGGDARSGWRWTFSTMHIRKRTSQFAARKKSKADAWSFQGAEVPDCLPMLSLTLDSVTRPLFL